MAQHDYVIDNQLFPETRADINAALQAIVTQNSGATAPASPNAGMPWFDTVNQLLKIRNNTNTGWNTVGEVTLTPALTAAIIAELGALAVKDTITAGDVEANTLTLEKLQQLSANVLLGRDGSSGNVSTITCTSAGRSLLGGANASDQRTALGLGTIATQAASNVAITGGSVAGITDLAIADGGTGASTAANARTNLGLGTIATQAASNVAITGGSVAGITDLAIADGGTGASTATDARTNLGLGTANTVTFDTVLSTWQTTPKAATATIASGVVTATGSVFGVDTEGGAATDDLDTINLPVAQRIEGATILINSTSGARDVTIKHNTGNIQTTGSIDKLLGTSNNCMLLRNNAATGATPAWREVASNI